MDKENVGVTIAVNLSNRLAMSIPALKKSCKSSGYWRLLEERGLEGQ